MKRLSVVLAFLMLLFQLFTYFGMAESEGPGDVLRRDAAALLERAQSKEDVLKALATYSRALEYFLRANAPGKAKDVLIAMARCHTLQLGQYAEALEYYKKALEIQTATRDVYGAELTQIEIGNLYQVSGRFQEAVDQYKKVLDNLVTPKNPANEFMVLNNIGSCYFELGKYHEAQDYLEKALRQTTGEDAENHLKSGILNGLALIHSALGQYDIALDYSAKALEIARTRDDPAGEVAVLQRMVDTYGSAGQFKEALTCAEQGVAIAHRSGNAGGLAKILSSVGMIYGCLGMYEDALDYYRSAIKISGQHDPELTAESLSDMGFLYRYLGLYDQTLQSLKRALKIAQTVPHLVDQRRILLLMGEVFLDSGQHEKALESYNDALRIRPVTRVKVPDATLEDRKGWVYLAMGDVAKAEPLLKRSGLPRSLGFFAIVQSNFPEAAKQYWRIIQECEAGVADREYLLCGYIGLGMALEGMKKYDLARQCYETGLQIAEALRSGLLPARRRNFLDVKQGGFRRAEAGKGVTRILMRLKKPEESIESSEAVRARAFADKMIVRSDARISGVPQEIRQKEDGFVAQLASLYKALSAAGGNKSSKQYNDIEDRINEVKTKQILLIKKLWEKYPSYAAVKYPNPVKLEQAAVRPDEYVIMYDVFDTGVGIKLIKGRTVVFSYIEDWPIKDLVKEVRQFRESFENTKLDKDDREGKRIKVDAFRPDLAHRLYKRLLQKALEKVSSDPSVRADSEEFDLRKIPKQSDGNRHLPRLTIIPDGELATIPFEALIIDKRNNTPSGAKYVGDRYRINYFQSLTVLTLSRTLAAKKNSGGRTLVMADPIFNYEDTRTFDKKTTMAQKVDKKKRTARKMIVSQEDITRPLLEMPRLEHTSELAGKLKQLIGEKCDVRTGLDADKKRFLKEIAPKLTDYRQVIFATHGLFTTTMPGILEPFIALTMVPPGTDGYLKMSDVLGLEMNADIVVLTACQTGLGREFSGEGVMSMGRAFQYAGAKSVLMSLWSVGESGSVKLTERFFRHLKEGRSKLEALRLARDEIRNEGYNHPYFWAPFILVGEADGTGVRKGLTHPEGPSAPGTDRRHKDDKRIELTPSQKFLEEILRKM